MGKLIRNGWRLVFAALALSCMLAGRAVTAQPLSPAPTPLVMVDAFLFEGNAAELKQIAAWKGVDGKPVPALEVLFQPGGPTGPLLRVQSAETFESLRAAVSVTPGLDIISLPHVIVKSGATAMIDISRPFDVPIQFTPDFSEFGKFLATDFEPRNIGAKMQASPQVTGSTVELQLFIECTTLEGIRGENGVRIAGDWDETEYARLLAKGALVQPLIDTHRLQSRVFCPPGKYILLEMGDSSIPIAQRQKRLFVCVGVSVLPQ